MSWRCFFGVHDWVLPIPAADIEMCFSRASWREHDLVFEGNKTTVKPDAKMLIPVILKCRLCDKQYAAKLERFYK